MKTNVEMVAILSSRLPELLWQMNKLKINVGLKNLPAGLFSHSYDRTPACCINEIKADLNGLKSQMNPRSAHFLVDKIARKINVLVCLCQLQSVKEKTTAPPKFSIQAISTRQQWLQSLETEINALTEQRQALEVQHAEAQQKKEMQKVLSLQSDLGEIERQLTLAKETWKKAVS